MNKTSLMVSVVIPVYNAESYLRNSLEVILNQSYKQIEIIYVNDGSLDGSLKILQTYQKQDERIKIVDKKNEGANYARRDGVKIARGEWVAFIDADDIIKIDYIETLVRYIESKADVVVGETRVVHERVIPHSISSSKSTLVTSKEEVYRMFIRQWVPLMGGAPVVMISPWAKIIRKSVLDKNDWFLSNYSSGNDSLMMRQVFQNMKGSLRVIHEPIYFYYVESNGLGSKKEIITNEGKKISRLEYEMQRYDRDASHIEKMNYKLIDDIALNRIDILYNYLINYMIQNVLTYSDRRYIEKAIINIKLDFESAHIKSLVEKNYFDYKIMQGFYNKVHTEGVDSYIIDYCFDSILQSKNFIKQKNEALRDAKDNILLLERSRDELKDELNNVYGSHSWKITKPLRSMYEKIFK